MAKKISFSNVCSHEHSFILDNWIRRLFQPPKKLIGEYISPGITVIDLGCGPGHFSIDMAKMVGASGQVIAVDLQSEMLKKTEQKAIRYQVSKQMIFHQCKQDTLDLDVKADFILAFYMVHETPDTKIFLQEVKGLLKPNGSLLVVEPYFHVSKSKFNSMLDVAKDVGLRAIKFPERKGGQAVLFSL